MPKFAANLAFWFTELAFLERFKAARDAGFHAVEFMFPYDYKKEELVKRLHDNELELILHNLPAGNWAGGERGIACHPGRIREFRDGVELALEYAQALGVRRFNCLTGVQPADTSFKQARETAVANLAFAAQALRNAGIELLICSGLSIGSGTPTGSAANTSRQKTPSQALAGSRGTNK
jgi:hydroxypyruvate isomerase